MARKLSAKAQAHVERYTANLHAVQSGIAILQNYGTDQTGETSPKHLRVGVNSALMETAALQTVLYEKGIITPEEFFKALADLSEHEVQSYEEIIRERLGSNVNLKLG